MKVNVIKKRLKMIKFLIDKKDDKNVALDFYGEMEFNIHEGCDEP